jgi:hypothetical protein
MMEDIGGPHFTEDALRSAAKDRYLKISYLAAPSSKTACR